MEARIFGAYSAPAKTCGSGDAPVVRYRSVNFPKNRPVVAYKGGQYELDLLTTMNNPTCNIEQWDCPKVDVIKAQFPRVDPLVHMCFKGNHALASDLELIHCPKLKVTLFSEFMANKWKENRHARKRQLNKKAVKRRILRQWIWGDYKRV